MTYAAARAAAADALHPGTGGLLRTPNNILGIEYCKAILHRHAALTPLALPRLGAAHGGGAGAHAGTPMASASFLRGLPQPDWEPFVPARAAELYGRAAADGLLLDGARLETAVLALLRMQDPADFAQVRGVSEGLENHLTAAVREADSLDDLYTRLKTKRYPMRASAAAGAGRGAWLPGRTANAAVPACAGGTQSGAAAFKTGVAARRDSAGRPGPHRS